MYTPKPISGRKRPGSNVAFAIALMCGAAVTTGVVAAPAFAQKAEKPDYTKKFLEVYQGADALLKAEPANVAGAQAALPAVLAEVKTNDDKMVAGGLVYNVGVAAEDNTLQRQGFDLMIESGKVPAEKQGQYYYNSGQLAYQVDDFDVARARFKEALAAGYTEADLENVIASTFFNEDRYAEGLAYYDEIIKASIAAGEMPSEDWVFRAFSAAYNNDMALEAIELANINVLYYPSAKSWRNAISVQRNFVQMQDDVLLDLLRLADRTDTLDGGRDYAEYIEAADARKFPGEVKRVLDEALASGALEASDPFVVDVRGTVSDRLAADRAELPALERDARAASATGLTATAAGDVFLSYGQAAKAEEMYAIAAGKPDANIGRVMTRMGIAQADQGKFTEAEATFKQVGGARKAVGAIWAAYANIKAVDAAPAAPVM